MDEVPASFDKKTQLASGRLFGHQSAQTLLVFASQFAQQVGVGRIGLGTADLESTTEIGQAARIDRVDHHEVVLHEGAEHGAAALLQTDGDAPLGMLLVELEEELIQRLGLLFHFASCRLALGGANEQAVLLVGPVQADPCHNGIWSGSRIVVLCRVVFHRMLSLVLRQALDRRKPYREPSSRRPLSIRFGPKRRAGSESLSRCVQAHGSGNSSSQPGVTPFGQAKAQLLTSKYFHGAKVIHRRLRREEARLSSPPMNNFGIPIRVGEGGVRAYLGDAPPLPSLLLPQGRRGRRDNGETPNT